MNAVKYEPGPSSIRVMRMERMRRAAPERQKGLDVEWAERSNERRPQQKASMQGCPSPCWGGGGRNTRGEQEGRDSPSFLKARLRLRSRPSPMKTSKTLTDRPADPHVHVSRVQRRVQGRDRGDEDVKSLTAAIRLGGSETREARQKQKEEKQQRE